MNILFSIVIILFSSSTPDRKKHPIYHPTFEDSRQFQKLEGGKTS
jgi:hypothetical protein